MDNLSTNNKHLHKGCQAIFLDYTINLKFAHPPTIALQDDERIAKNSTLKEDEEGRGFKLFLGLFLQGSRRAGFFPYIYVYI